MWGIGRKGVAEGTSEWGNREKGCWEKEPVNVGNREKNCWVKEPVNVGNREKRCWKEEPVKWGMGRKVVGRRNQ